MWPVCDALDHSILDQAIATLALFFIVRHAILVAWWASSLPMQSSREALLIPHSFPTHQAINSRLGELCRFRKFPSLDARSTANQSMTVIRLQLPSYSSSAVRLLQVVAAAGSQSPGIAASAQYSAADMIETFPSDRANQPFRMSILPWRLGRGWPVANARGAKPPGEKFALDPVAIADNGPRWAVCEPGRH